MEETPDPSLPDLSDGAADREILAGLTEELNVDTTGFIMDDGAPVTLSAKQYS